MPPLLAAAVREGEALPRLHSLIVSQRGTVLVERYFHGMRATRLANVKSVAKSVISALVGAAVSRGLIPSVREPIATYFAAELRAPGDAPKRAITVEDLLTMRSGLETTSNRNYGAWVRSPNWVRFALAQPLLTTPGTAMDYSTGSTHLLSAILTKATRKTTLQFAQETLGRPLGFTVAPWTRDPQGIYFGGNDMAMTPRQMLAFGEMYLREGRAGDMQVLPAQWIRDSWVPRGRSIARATATIASTATAGGCARWPGSAPTTRGGSAGSSSSSCRHWTSWSSPHRPRRATTSVAPIGAQ